MEPLSALLIATTSGLTDYALSALPDAPVVPDRRRMPRFRRTTAPAVIAPAPVLLPEGC